MYDTSIYSPTGHCLWCNQETAFGLLSHKRDCIIASGKDPRLQPCPFCGCKDIRIEGDSSLMFAFCNECNAKGGYTRSGLVENPRERICEKWNKRANVVFPVQVLRIDSAPQVLMALPSYVKENAPTQFFAVYNIVGKRLDLYVYEFEGIDKR